MRFALPFLLTRRLAASSGLLLFLVLAPVQAQDLPALEDGVREHFERSHTVVFPANLIIGEITSLAIAPNGDMLVVDAIGGEAWLFDGTGALLRALQPERCTPGFTMRPQGAIFAGADHIILQNAAPSGYLFNRDGTCVGPMAPAFRPPRHMVFDDEVGLFGLHNNVGGGTAFEIRKMTVQGDLMDAFDLAAEEPFPNAARRFLGGGLVIRQDRIYHASPLSPALNVYSKQGELIEVMEPRIDAFKRITADIPARIDNPLFQKRLSASLGHDTVFSLHALGSDKLLMETTGENGYRYHILSVDGAVVTSEYSDEGRFFMTTAGACAYRVRQLPVLPSGELPNPYVEVLRYGTTEE